jgi:hypothetical protein
MRSLVRNPHRWGALLSVIAFALLPDLAAAQGGDRGDDRGPRPQPGFSVRGILTAIDVPGTTLQIALFDVATTSVRFNAATVITKGGQRVAAAELAVGDMVAVVADRRTRVASRVEVVANPSVTFAAYLTALDAAAGTLQLTTGHGTSITLRTTASTQVRLNGRTTTLAGLAVGEIVQARYALADRTALELNALAPRSLIGTLVGIDAAARTVQYTNLGGTTNSVSVTANTRFRLNGRTVTPAFLTPGLAVEIGLNLADNSALDVSARTPAILEMTGTVASLDAAAGTIQVGTPYGTAISLRTTPTTAIQLNGAASNVAALAPGDRVRVSYQLALAPGVSMALAVAATR